MLKCTCVVYSPSALWRSWRKTIKFLQQMFTNSNKFNFCEKRFLYFRDVFSQTKINVNENTNVFDTTLP